MFLLYLFILAVLHGVNSQGDCIPDPVSWIQLDPDYVLHWDDYSHCEITKFIIYITPVEGGETNIFESEERRINVPHLPMCEVFRFTVVAVSHNIASTESSLEAMVPAMPGTNITVTHMHAIQQSENTIYLEWELDPEFAHCVERFRVARYDLETIPVSQYATGTNTLIQGVAPCTHFELTVTPIYGNMQEGGVGVMRYDTPGHNLHTPTLIGVSQGTDYVEMTWRLIAYQVNRCQITSILVDGSPYTNISVPFTDSRTRPAFPVRVESLLPDKMYQFRLSVINSAGASKAYPIAIQTLPLAEVSG